jgi:hypothetical protein
LYDSRHDPIKRTITRPAGTGRPAVTQACTWLIAEDFYCGNPTPSRRYYYCKFHESVSTLQRKSALKADALAIEHQAACRLADEYDAAQERGELSVQGQHKSHVPSENMRASNEDIGLSRKTVFEARQIRDAEKADPGIVKRTLDEQIERGEEPTINCLRVTLIDLAQGMCKFPIGDPRSDDFRYCGNPAPGRASYCPTHSKRARG